MGTFGWVFARTEAIMTLNVYNLPVSRDVYEGPARGPASSLDRPPFHR